ncbi:hypothetical protein LguiA_027704 [Lonicera macranthoides]
MLTKHKNITLYIIFGSPRVSGRMLSLRRTNTVKNRKIVIGLKSDNSSREMLLRLLAVVVLPGDNVLAVHVQDSNDSFDPNTFYIHEDICKSKQVDFQVTICTDNSYLTGLSYQDSKVSYFLKALPPTCSLMVVDNGGRILLQCPGTSQQGSASKVLQSSQSVLSRYSSYDQPQTGPQMQKSLSMPSTSTLSSVLQTEKMNQSSFKKTLQLPDSVSQKLFQRLATLEVKGSGTFFSSERLKRATNDFSPEFLIGEGGHSNVYQALLENGQAVAVKVFKNTESSEDDLFREVEILSGLEHGNIIQLIGYCCGKEMYAIVYNLEKGSLKQKLKQLTWSERMRVAIGVAKALDYIHSCSPPIIHRDVKSSNILLSDNCEPQLSDFGAAVVHQQVSGFWKPINVVGTFGYMAPEYMMYGKVDEKIDVYSYGVVLLELITGKEALQTNQGSNYECLVLWARSLLRFGLCERLIDPCLNGGYNVEEMKTMIIAARFCLLHSSSRRPKMKRILQLFEEPEQSLKMQRKREELLNIVCPKGKTRRDDI